MNVNAKVVKTDGDFAVVESKRLSACEGCHRQAEGCSVCSVMGADKTVSIRAKNNIGAAEGDIVEIETKTRTVLFYALMVFILPIIAALAFYGVACYLDIEEKLRYIPAALGFVIAFFFIWLYSKFVVAKRCDAEIVKIIKKKIED